MCEVQRALNENTDIAPSIAPRLMSVLAAKARAAAVEMSSALMRSAVSSLINGAKDFSSAILAGDGRTIVMDEGLPVHVGSAHLAVKYLRQFYEDDIEPGDVFVNNSPFLGTTHHADMTYLAPVFGASQILYWAFSRAHHADVGAPEPTSYLPNAATVQQEGIHIPCLRIVRGNREVSEIVRMIKARMRMPDAWYADHSAQVSSVRTGVRRMEEILAAYDESVLSAFTQEWMAYGERMMRSAIRRMNGGVWRGEVFHDPVTGAERGIPVRAVLQVDPDAELVTVDLRDNDDNIEGGLNLTEATTLAGAYIGVLNNIGADVPRNAGSLSRIRVLMRKGAVVGIPRPNVGTSVATTNVCDRLVNLIQSLFASAGEPYGMAEGSTGLAPNFSVISGFDRRRRAIFVNQTPIGFGGGPGKYGHDGWLTYNKPVTGGAIRAASVEMNELASPVLYQRIEIVPDTGGTGRWEGAPSVLTEFGPRFDELVAAYVGDSCVFPPRGVLGGGNGGPGRALRRDQADCDPREIPTVSTEVLLPGETLISVWPGGGGYGNPSDRDTSAIVASLERGWITEERAQHVYGLTGGWIEDGVAFEPGPRRISEARTE